MNVTRAEYATLTRRRAAQALSATFPVKEGWEGGALVIFVPGLPTNMKNKVGHWSKRHRWAKSWRERTAAALSPHWQIGAKLLMASTFAVAAWIRCGVTPETPKLVTFTIFGRSRFDDDNAALVCSPCRDALQDMGVIDDDRPSSGHEFRYEQAKPTRKAGSVYGISIRVELKA